MARGVSETGDFLGPLSFFRVFWLRHHCEGAVDPRVPVFALAKDQPARTSQSLWADSLWQWKEIRTVCLMSAEGSRVSPHAISPSLCPQCPQPRHQEYGQLKPHVALKRCCHPSTFCTVCGYGAQHSCERTVLTAKPTQETAKIVQEQTHIPILAALPMALCMQVQCRKQPAKHDVQKHNCGLALLFNGGLHSLLKISTNSLHWITENDYGSSTVLL